MHFSTKNILKSNRKHTLKQTLRLKKKILCQFIMYFIKIIFKNTQEIKIFFQFIKITLTKSKDICTF